MSDILIIISIAIGLCVFILAFWLGRTVGGREGQEFERKEKDDAYVREILSRDREIKNYQRKIDNLNDLNSQYLTFMFKVPTVIQRLNSTLNLQNIVDTIIHLIKDVIPTPLVELYLYSASDGTLKNVSAKNIRNNGNNSDIKGKELIESAARDRIVRISGQMHTATAPSSTSHTSEPRIWMAVPIIFRERLLGVIGIGRTEKLAGNETDIMKMIADISAVTLVNQTMLGEAKHQANTDVLTGISNRNYFIQMGQTFIEKAIRDSSQISIFFFDIDNFKHYNDTNGHDAGDRLLIELTAMVSNITRKNVVFARYGGEEFIVMMPGITKEDTLIYAERVREKIAQHSFFNRESQPLGCVSISGGIATFPVDGNTLTKTIQLADESLYQAKAQIQVLPRSIMIGPPWRLPTS